MSKLSLFSTTSTMREPLPTASMRKCPFITPSTARNRATSSTPMVTCTKCPQASTTSPTLTTRLATRTLPRATHIILRATCRLTKQLTLTTPRRTATSKRQSLTLPATSHALQAPTLTTPEHTFRTATTAPNITLMHSTRAFASTGLLTAKRKNMSLRRTSTWSPRCTSTCSELGPRPFIPTIFPVFFRLHSKHTLKNGPFESN
mmetsp:Transcript_34065/g.42059  ORF Transcript_34065/g.42059 Transcript_34065/m.42059 type:complete len:204 (+) Transcript_34065:3573-4184(+)